MTSVGKETLIQVCFTRKKRDAKMIEPYNVMMRIVGSPSMTAIGANAVLRFLKTLLLPLILSSSMVGLVFRTVSGRNKVTRTKTIPPIQRAIRQCASSKIYTCSTKYCCKVKSGLPPKKLAKNTAYKWPY